MVRTSRKKRLSVGVIGALALMMVMPAGAMAGSSRHRDRDHRDGRRVERDRDHRGDHGKVERRNAHRRIAKRDRRDRREHLRRDRHDRRFRDGHRHRSHAPYYAYAKVHEHVRYYCWPCNHYFDRRDRFHAHLTTAHLLAVWQLPFVILHHALGWAYYG